MAVMSARTYIPVPGGPAPTDLPPAAALIPEQRIPEQPQPLKSLVASATRITSETIRNSKGFTRTSAEQWQEDAWEMYDLVGEMRFLVNVLASQGSKARFYVGKLSDDPTDPPIPVDDTRLKDALEAIGDGPSGLSQLIKRLLMNLSVVGDGYIVGIPKQVITKDSGYVAPVIGGDRVSALANASLDDLEWRMLSVSEVKYEDDDIVLHLGHEHVVKANPDDIYPIRVWNPHPRKSWEADSPTRSALPVLRELVGFTMHISAQIDSRLAGAGVLIIPAGAVKAARIAQGLPEEGPENPLVEDLITGMITPISDRSNASAYVPLVWTFPDDVADKVQHLDFSKGLDIQAKDMRDEALRRYALSADAPPELLLGLGDMNHWGAWIVGEETVRTHLEPPLALVSDAITVQYLRPVMEEMGFTPDEIENHVVWYDVEHLIVRVNRPGDASNLHSSGAVNDKALRDAYSFSDDDAPQSSLISEARRAAFEMVKADPTLLDHVGAIVETLEALLDPNGELPEPEEVPEPEPAPEPIVAEPAADEVPVEGNQDGAPPAEIAEPAPAGAPA